MRQWIVGSAVGLIVACGVLTGGAWAQTPGNDALGAAVARSGYTLAGAIEHVTRGADEVALEASFAIENGGLVLSVVTSLHGLEGPAGEAVFVDYSGDATQPMWTSTVAVYSDAADIARASDERALLATTDLTLLDIAEKAETLGRVVSVRPLTAAGANGFEVVSVRDGTVTTTVYDLMTGAAPAAPAAPAQVAQTPAAPVTPTPPAQVAQPPAAPATPAATATPAAPAGGLAPVTFTAQQARSGNGVFNDVCSGCHGDGGGMIGPHWQIKTAGEFYQFISTQMPADAPGSRTPAEYLSAMAFLLSKAGYPAGTIPLPSDRAALDGLSLAQGGAAPAPSAPAAPATPAPAPSPAPAPAPAAPAAPTPAPAAPAPAATPAPTPPAPPATPAPATPAPAATPAPTPPAAPATPAPVPVVTPPAPAAPAGGLTPVTFTAQQARSGNGVFNDVCSGCHGDGGGMIGPHWQIKTAGEFYQFISTQMPADAPGSRTPAEYLSAMAFLLSKAGYPAGTTPLPSDRAALDGLSLAQGGAAPAPGPAPTPPPVPAPTVTTPAPPTAAPTAPTPAPAPPATPAPPAPATPATPSPATPAPAPATPATPAAPTPTPTVAPSGPAAPAATQASYTTEQANRGARVYADNCSGCHGSGLGGQAEAPGLIGNGFRNTWFADQPAAKMFDFLTAAMPQQAPGSLTPEQYADLTAFLMSKNRIVAGSAELPHDSAMLATLTISAAAP